MASSILIAALVATLLWSCQAYSFFRDEIPNGHSVEHPCKNNALWNGVGHLREQGGGPRNPFGLAFDANGKKWTKSLCLADSDGDGQSNGAELGDPDCSWSKGGTATRTTGITHPGFKTPATRYPFNSADPASLDCGGKPVNCPAKNNIDTKTMDLRNAPGTKVPNETTTYFCTSFKVPTDLVYHAFAFDAMLDNLNVIHHMLLYGCKDATIPAPGQCDMSSQGCRDLLAVWSIGLPDQCMPDVVGIRFGKGTYQSVQLQVHWNNPQNLATYTDTSGLRVHYTSKLRLYDMGIMWLGQSQIFVPARTANTTYSAKCSSDCTKELLLQPINITASIAHMHLLGRQSRILHTSSATNTTRQILFDDEYDYNSPKWTQHTPEVVVNPRDSLELVCTYNSSKRAQNTTYGDGTGDEMCFGFLQYYPKGGDFQCTEYGEYPLCFISSVVCGPKCPLSVFMENVTEYINRAWTLCDDNCSVLCKESIHILVSLWEDGCVATRIPEQARLFRRAVYPRLELLYKQRYACQLIDKPYFETPPTNVTFNTPAQISASCPSDEGLERHKYESGTSSLLSLPSPPTTTLTVRPGVSQVQINLPVLNSQQQALYDSFEIRFRHVADANWHRGLTSSTSRAYTVPGTYHDGQYEVQVQAVGNDGRQSPAKVPSTVAVRAVGCGGFFAGNARPLVEATGRVGADIVIVIDESSSMEVYQEWLADTVGKLEDALTAKGIGSTASLRNHFAVVGFGRGPPPLYIGCTQPRAFRNAAGEKVFTVDSYPDVNSQLVAHGSHEDGYVAIKYALENITDERGANLLRLDHPDVVTNVILVTDEDRDTCGAHGRGINKASLKRLMRRSGAVLNVVADQRVRGDASGRAIGLDSKRVAYIAEASGNYSSMAGGSISWSFHKTKRDYSSLALALGGTAWDIDILKQGGDASTSFTNAFLEVKTREIAEQLEQCRYCQCVGEGESPRLSCRIAAKQAACKHEVADEALQESLLDG